MLKMPTPATRKIGLQSKHYVDLSANMGDDWYVRYLTVCLEVAGLERLRNKIQARCAHTLDEMQPCDCKKDEGHNWLWALLTEKVNEVNRMYYEENARQLAPVVDFINHANQAHKNRAVWKEWKRKGLVPI